jgi:predicted metal-dependent hydrolase
MRRKWGSCSSAGTVTLAADLVAQDERFQDYVIVHELLHLRYTSHGRMFKALMSAHVPEWRRIAVSRNRQRGAVGG